MWLGIPISIYLERDSIDACVHLNSQHMIMHEWHFQTKLSYKIVFERSAFNGIRLAVAMAN